MPTSPDVDVHLTADEIAMLTVLVGIFVGCMAILAWVMGDGVDGVVGLFSR